MLDSPPAAWSRVLITDVRPIVDGGRWPIKRIAGDAVTVTADIVADGHDLVAAEIRFGPRGGDLGAVRMAALGNDAYAGTFAVESPGRSTYQVRAWIDQFATWRDLFRRRIEGGSPAEEIASELHEGAALLERAAARGGPGATRLLQAARSFRSGDPALALEPEIAALAADGDPRAGAEEGPLLEIHVERARPIRRLVCLLCSFHRCRRRARHAGRRGGAAALHQGAGLRRRLPAADPSHRHHRAQGEGQHRHRGAG